MAIPIGGLRPVDGALFYQNGNNYSNVLLDVRTRMLELQQIQTRNSYVARIQNYGDITQEMQAEFTRNAITPKSGANYTIQEGTPLFLETTRADVNVQVARVLHDNVGGSGNTSTSTEIYYSQNNPGTEDGHIRVGQKIEIYGQEREISAILQAPSAANDWVGRFEISQALDLPAMGNIPRSGADIYIKGLEYSNPHLNETYRVTDQFGSFDGFALHRYQVNRQFGYVRFRPSPGQTAAGADVANQIWHPEDAVDTPYYFGKRVEVKQVPPAAGPANDGIANNEVLGAVDDPIASGSNTTTPIPIAPAPATYNAAQLTNFALGPPDGEYSNITVTAPANVAFEVELNGAKLAIVPDGGQITIPFFDPDYTNDAQKANDQLDPDVYIQRFIKEGGNHLVIKATQKQAGARGIQVEGFFNGINLNTGEVDNSAADPNGFLNTKVVSSASDRADDWSVSKHSIMGIAGKVDFQLGDTIAVEDINDEIQKAQGVLESLTTIIAGTDVNQFQSILSVLR